MTKVLHVSHHYGCMKDHQYICKKLNFELTNQLTLWSDENDILPKGYFRCSKEVANTIWNKSKDYFNQFDVIIISDTSPLSRIFLQNIQNVKPKIIVWICNRFDYDFENDLEYYKLISESIQNKNIKFIPYTEFERLWLNHRGIQCLEETVRPHGVSLNEPISDKEKYNMGLGGENYKMEINQGDILVSRYHNDINFQNSNEVCKTQNVKSATAFYRGPEELKNIVNNFDAFLALPDAYSKFSAFEYMQNSMPVIAPSQDYLLKLYNMPNYHFSTGLWQNTVGLCEWYNEYYKTYAIYINDMSEIANAVAFVKSNKEEIVKKIKICADNHLEKTLNQWKRVYETL